MVRFHKLQNVIYMSIATKLRISITFKISTIEMRSVNATMERIDEIGSINGSKNRFGHGIGFVTPNSYGSPFMMGSMKIHSP